MSNESLQTSWWDVHQLLLRIRTQYVFDAKYSWFSISIHAHVVHWHGTRNVNWMIPSLPILLSIFPFIWSIHLFVLYLFPFWPEMVFTVMHTVAMRHIKWNTNNQRMEFMASFLVRESNFYQVLEQVQSLHPWYWWMPLGQLTQSEANFNTGSMHMHTSSNIQSDIIFNWHGTWFWNYKYILIIPFLLWCDMTILLLLLLPLPPSLPRSLFQSLIGCTPKNGNTLDLWDL